MTSLMSLADAIGEFDRQRYEAGRAQARDDIRRNGLAWSEATADHVSTLHPGSLYGAGYRDAVRELAAARCCRYHLTRGPLSEPCNDSEGGPDAG